MNYSTYGLDETDFTPMTKEEKKARKKAKKEKRRRMDDSIAMSSRAADYLTDQVDHINILGGHPTSWSKIFD